MATIKSHTDLEQSNILAKILPLESADMYYSKYNTIHANTLYSSCDRQYFHVREYTPCWSLAALLGVLPEGIIEKFYVPNLQKEDGKYSIAYGDDELLCIADNPVDACVKMILKLHKLNLL